MLGLLASLRQGFDEFAWGSMMDYFGQWCTQVSAPLKTAIGFNQRKVLRADLRHRE